jgi:hypothetical protein
MDLVAIIYAMESFFSYVVVPADNTVDVVGLVTDADVGGEVAGPVLASEAVADLQGES